MQDASADCSTVQLLMGMGLIYRMRDAYFVVRAVMRDAYWNGTGFLGGRMYLGTEFGCLLGISTVSGRRSGALG